MTTTFDFTGQHVAVFGGTTGINFGIASAFADRGARVTIVSRKQENVDGALAILRERGAVAQGMTADVRDFDAVGQTFAAACKTFGPVDVLVSGAAGNFLAEANQLSSNGFKVVVDIDLNGTFHVMRQAFAYLSKPGASVINITAPQAVIPMRYQSHVCAAKAGVDQLTRVLAIEWGGAGVRVNAISPGPIAGTEGMRRLAPEGHEEEGSFVQQRVPLGRLGTADDIANLAMFLGSTAASYISGAIVPCDGGGAIDSIKPMIETAGANLNAS
ncbi:SDR family oxidoreductase [Burkholderia lata]|uniref:Short-chain dehydrogenase n=1 Tax=Burkholderia lata (strain ATCC 17760 / DSM 23089 / LMG 22485 / NCIMB 9086 / R18194 / 383) TaxID=482957 RepID=A0A6P2I7N1_BURL3|nr:SDR family oxidoreductase [Burkholderia lata]VWB25324.1 short-chain dehydrogenase [Burkholderia lata]